MRRHTARTKKAARILYELHHSTYKVGEILNVNPTVVHKWVADLVPRSKQKRKFTNDMKVVAATRKLAGESATTLAKEFGCHAPTIYAWVNAFQQGKLN